MTAISPLQSIHKKGLFGDHHKKNESDLLLITELKNLSIFQIAEYKKTKNLTDKVEIDGLKLSLENSKVLSNKNTRILWISPKTYLVISKREDIRQIIEQNCNNQDFATTDISHSRSVIQIKGENAKEVLKKGCPLNIEEFKKNNCAGSVFNGINIVLDCLDVETPTFNVLTLRSFGESLYHHITDSSLEFGYLGI